MNKKQTVIIGGGLQGLASANALLDRGEDVLVLERREGVGMETSFSNAGMITPSQPEPWNSKRDIIKMLSSLGNENSVMLIRLKAIPSIFTWGLRFILNSSSKRFHQTSLHNFNLSKYSKDLTRSFREMQNITYEESTLGTLKIFRNNQSLNESLNSLSKLRDHGIVYRELNVEDLVKVEPQLKEISQDLKGGIIFEEDETGDAYLFCKELEKIIREKGGRIHTSTEIIGFLSHRKKIMGVKTSRVDIQTNRVVIAAGSWSYQLTKLLGLNLPIRPVKGYSTTLDLEDNNLCPSYAVIDEDLHAAITPFKNRIRVAGTAEFAGFDDELKKTRIDNLLDILKMTYPTLASELVHEEAKIWSGFRPMSSDGRPFIGKTKIDGLFVNSGQGHLGWTMAMGSAAILADIMNGRDPEIDSSPFLASRSI